MCKTSANLSVVMDIPFVVIISPVCLTLHLPFLVNITGIFLLETNLHLAFVIFFAF